jgi:hypothetical protein
VAGLRAGQSRVQIPAGARDFSETSRPVLVPSQYGEMQNANCSFLIESCIFDGGSTHVPSLTFIWTVHGHCIIRYNVSVADVKLFGFYSPKEGDCWFQNVVARYIVTVMFIGYAFVFTKTLHRYCACTLY